MYCEIELTSMVARQEIETKAFVDRWRSLDRQKCLLGEAANRHNSGRSLSHYTLQRLPDMLEVAVGCQQDTG